MYNIIIKEAGTAMIRKGRNVQLNFKSYFDTIILCWGLQIFWHSFLYLSILTEIQMKQLASLLMILFFALTSFRDNTEKKVTVAVAANVQYAMEAIKAKFEQETGIKVEVIVGSSGKLTQQIQEGAPFDVFVSADTKYPLTLYQNKLTTASPKVYATGVLVLWTARDDIKPTADLSFLLQENIKKIALANPQTAPYGAAAEELLKTYKLYDRVQSKLVFGESIAQTNQFIITKSADVGFTAKSVVLADEIKGKGVWIELDRKAYKPIEQAAVILKHGGETNRILSEKFYNYLYSKSAKEIFSKFGYLLK